MHRILCVEGQATMGTQSRQITRACVEGRAKMGNTVAKIGTHSRSKQYCSGGG